MAEQAASEQEEKKGRLEEPAPKLILTSSPHQISQDSIERIMWTVVLSLAPTSLAGLYFFGWGALYVLIVSVCSTMAAEAIYQKASGERISVTDGSAAVTGLLLGLTLPPGAPWWLCIVGGFFAIIICKQLYGGLGFNPFNPALMARVFLLIAFPLHMTKWPVPHPVFTGIDATTGATPLGDLQVARLTGKGIGEAYLLYKQYITWHIPVSMIGTVMVFSGIFWWIDPAKYANPVFHLLTGGLIIGAFFMATDMVT